jgi:protein involved in polysaccharide export with SLBB domain
MRQIPLLSLQLLLCVINSSVAYGQLSRTMFDDMMQVNKGESETLQKLLMSSSAGPQFPLESPVDPSSYHVGPGDQYLLSIPLLSDAPIPVLISYDNIAILPRGIVIDVSHRTLAGFRGAIDSAYRSRQGQYSNLTLALIKPRLIQVSVTGCVDNPGVYLLTSAHRAAGVLSAAGQVSALSKLGASAIRNQLVHQNGSATDTLGLGNVAWKHLSPRFITIQHQNGIVEQADLIRYRVTGNALDNPHLQEGDVVIVQ